MNHISKSDYHYTPLFCEENIWHLAKSLIANGTNEDNISIIFLSNFNKQIAVFNQLSVEPGQVAFWDYHVILLLKKSAAHYIFDFDSRLGFVSSYDDYIKNSLPNTIHPQYRSQFRIIQASFYLKCFYSDRSHMQDIIAESQFPNYPAILPNVVNKLKLKDLFDLTQNIDNTSIIYKL